MANNPDQSSDGGDKELLQQKQQYTNEVNSLKKQISANDKKQQDLIDRIRAAKQANNYPLANQLQKEYDSLDATNAQLQNQLSVAQNNLNQTNQALTEYYNDMSDNLDGAYRIPSNMRELQAMYKLQWQDEGEWVNGSGEYTFVRHAYCPSAKANVTYTAVLKLARKPKYFLGIRIHRPILSVDFTLSGNSSAENVVEVMKLDMKKTEKERTEEVNKRLKELMEDMPDCSISIRYEYSNKVDTSDDESDNSIHLLWASDRLDIARDVEYQLTEIYSQLVFLEHVMQARQSLLDFLKHQILDVVTRRGRGTIAEYCLQRWEDASIAAMSKTNNVKKDSTTVNNNTGKNNKVMRRNIIRYILVVISFFSVLGVQAQGDVASLEAMIKNHKQVRGLLEVRVAAELGVLEYHKLNAKKVNDYRAVSDTLDRYRRCFDVVDLILKTGATAFHTVNASKRVSANIKGYWNLVDTYTNKILLHGAIWPSDTIILTTSKKTVKAIEAEAKELKSSYNDFVLLVGGKNSPKETKVLDLMECLDKINTSIDNIDNYIAAAYLELWGYMNVRMGFWKKRFIEREA